MSTPIPFPRPSPGRLFFFLLRRVALCVSVSMPSRPSCLSPACTEERRWKRREGRRGIRAASSTTTVVHGAFFCRNLFKHHLLSPFLPSISCSLIVHDGCTMCDVDQNSNPEVVTRIIVRWRREEGRMAEWIVGAFSSRCCGCPRWDAEF